MFREIEEKFYTFFIYKKRLKNNSNHDKKNFQNLDQMDQNWSYISS